MIRRALLAAAAATTDDVQHAGGVLLIGVGDEIIFETRKLLRKPRPCSSSPFWEGETGPWITVPGRALNQWCLREKRLVRITEWWLGLQDDQRRWISIDPSYGINDRGWIE